MNLSKSRIIIALVVVVAAAIGVFLLSSRNRADAGIGEPRYKEMKVERGTFREIVTANGVVRPIDRVEIKSKASGQIEELAVEVGDFVRKGDLIARLDQKDERAAVKQAEADFDIARAELIQAQRAFDRLDQLFKDRLISEEERDQIELRLAVANGNLVRATTTLERARERFAESVVRAPVDGVILQKYVEEGQIIASGVSNVSGGTPIVDIADMRNVHIEAGIDEIDIGKIHIGQPARVVAEAYPMLKFKGKIVRIAPEARIEQNVTLFNVIIEVENTEGKLKSGMNASIEITIVEKENILLAPAVALQLPPDAKPSSRERMVLLKQGDRFTPHTVTIGLSNFKNAEIVSGLEEGSIIGAPMASRLIEENERMENRIRDSRGFGATGGSRSQ
ncbi:MAG: efflux RND transporter periplasmic adaptor subunit [Calditrichaceae bacterium]|nr:efflux RND transporter periplasmic adaptor subunit [Calditrichia bacterium]NUQ41985.1 efflux RND transporter periplasmic adaptor subunit [Calditrichaceae bacterium]